MKFYQKKSHDILNIIFVLKKIQEKNGRVCHGIFVFLQNHVKIHEKKKMNANFIRGKTFLFKFHLPPFIKSERTINPKKYHKRSQFDNIFYMNNCHNCVRL